MNRTPRNDRLPIREMARVLPFTLASSLVLPGPLHAAEIDGNTDEGFFIEEIIVTATKRAESLQDVSASVSAVSTADIEMQGLDSFEGLARSQPGVNLTQPTKNRSVFNIRGLSTSIVGGNTQDPVAVYINDIPVTDTFGAAVQPDLRLYDVERIEVLRGPQGTLFGSGSLGGTVRVITRKPELEAFDASVRVDFADTDSAGTRERYDAMVNIPLVDDSLALRAVGYYREEAGWVNNTLIGTDNSSRDWGGRLSLLWQASDNLDVKMEVLHQQSDPDDADLLNPEMGKFERSSTLAEGRPSELSNYNITLEYDIEDFATVISSTSYSESETALIADFGDVIGLGYPLVNRSQPWESEFLTHELRLVSNTESDLDWVAGIFYIDRDTAIDYEASLTGIADGINPLLDSLGLPLLEDDGALVSKILTASQELAAFGQLGYRFADSWKVTGGLRVSDTEVEYNEPQRETLNFATYIKEVSSLKSEGEDRGNVTWRATLAYEPTEDLHFYMNVSTGYRIGQVNTNFGPSVIDPSDINIDKTYQPDKTQNYEIGAKTQWWENRMIVNVAAYYIEWSDIQIDAFRSSDSLGFVANAGEAISQGLEVELQVLPLESLELNFALTLQDASIDSISAEDSLRSGVVEGDSLPGSYDYKVSGSAQYSWYLAGGEEMYARVSAQYIDESKNGFSQLAGTGLANPYLRDNASYENVDASIGLLVGQWELTGYGENLTNNDDYIVNLGGQTGGNSVTTLRPRTLGVRAHYRF